MALTTYTAATDIIKTLGTNPEDRPTLTDDTFKAKFDENSENIKTFLNAMIAELASTANGKGASQIGVEDSGSKFTATTVEAALAESATLISTDVANLATHKAEVVSQLITATRDLSVAGVQTITGLTAIPKRIEVRVNVNNATALAFSIGSWEANGPSQSNSGVYKNAASATVSGGSNVAVATVVNNETNYATGTIQNVTGTQFEINWVKTGLPTGTVTLQVIAHYH